MLSLIFSFITLFAIFAFIWAYTTENDIDDTGFYYSIIIAILATIILRMIGLI